MEPKAFSKTNLTEVDLGTIPEIENMKEKEVTIDGHIPDHILIEVTTPTVAAILALALDQTGAAVMIDMIDGIPTGDRRDMTEMIFTTTNTKGKIDIMMTEDMNPSQSIQKIIGMRMMATEKATTTLMEEKTTEDTTMTTTKTNTETTGTPGIAETAETEAMTPTIAKEILDVIMSPEETTTTIKRKDMKENSLLLADIMLIKALANNTKIDTDRPARTTKIATETATRITTRITIGTTGTTGTTTSTRIT